jgi:hypothetical protein
MGLEEVGLAGVWEEVQATSATAAQTNTGIEVTFMILSFNRKSLSGQCSGKKALPHSIIPPPDPCARRKNRQRIAVHPRNGLA